MTTKKTTKKPSKRAIKIANMQAEVSRCPDCKSTHVSFEKKTGAWFIECKRCHRTGITARSLKKVIEDWNA